MLPDYMLITIQDGFMEDLGGMVDAYGGYFDEAVSINNKGQILVNGARTVLDPTHAYLLSPVLPVAALRDGMLTVYGTDAGQKISITRVNSGTLLVMRGDESDAFGLNQIESISVFAGAGNDRIVIGSGVMGVYVDAGPGNDKVQGGEGKDTVTGGSGKDSLYGGEGDDRLNGNGTQDKLFGEGGNDRLYGGDHSDTLDGGGGVDRLFGDVGNDVLIGGSSNDKLYGLSGNDTLFGAKGADLLDGGAGTDTAANDVLDTRSGVENLI